MTSSIEPGRILLLWREGSYDGMATGIGLLDGQPVYLDASEQMGGWGLKPRWRELESLLDELLSTSDAENIWDRIEHDYEEQMEENQERVFEVRELPPDLFETAKARHLQWQLHAGLHCDFLYENGKPVYPGVPRYQEKIYWHNSTEYLKAHFYDVTESYIFPHKRIKASPLLGVISWKDLFAESEHKPPFPQDPRPDDLKAYQAAWKPGDPVKLDWS